MDREFAQMIVEYGKDWAFQFVNHGPLLLRVVLNEEHILVKQEALTCQQVSRLIENAKSFIVVSCACGGYQCI